MTRPLVSATQQAPLQAMPLPNDGKKTPVDPSRRNLFSRVYGGSKAAVQAKVSEFTSSDDDSYDYSQIAVDQYGLPLTSSDLHTAVSASQTKASCTEEEKLEEEEYSQSLILFHEAAQVFSSLPFQYHQSRQLYSNQTQDMSQISLKEGSGPGTLEELMALRLAMTNLLASFIHADPSKAGRLARKAKADTSNRIKMGVPSVKRKPVPYHDVGTETGSSSNNLVEAPELEEELATYDSPLINRKSPELRGVYTARALRKLEVDQISSSSDEQSEEENSMARYYIAKHRATRKAPNKGTPPSSISSCRRTKANRRTTSILDSKDEMKSYLLKSSGTSNYQRRSKDDFLNGLDEAHRRSTAPPVPIVHPRFTKIGEIGGDRNTYNTSSEKADSPKGSISNLSADSDTAYDAHTSSPPTSTHSESPSSHSSSLSTFSSPISSLHCFSSDEENDKSKEKVLQGTLKTTRAYSAGQVSRPRRHPARGISTSAVDHGVRMDVNKINHQSPTFNEDSQGLLLHYSQLESSSSSDATPRPNALGFDMGMLNKSK